MNYRTQPKCTIFTTPQISPHWCEATYTDAGKIVHCFSYGPYEQCFTTTCAVKFKIPSTQKSIDLVDNYCLKGEADSVIVVTILLYIFFHSMEKNMKVIGKINKKFLAIRRGVGGPRPFFRKN